VLVRFNGVPVARQGASLVLAFADLADPETLDEIEYLLARPLEAVIAPEGRVAAALRRHRGGDLLLEQASEGLRLQLLAEDETAAEPGAPRPEESPIVRLVDSLILGAIDKRASDIHLETKDREVLVKYRIDGVLYAALDPLDKKHHDTILSRLKVMSELDIAEKRVPQDGRFRLRVKGRTIDFRVSIMPSIHGEDAVVRILDKESLHAAFRDLRLDVLGFPEADLRKLRKYITEPYGMVLVTGPTGSGKTTTLYAALSEIATPEEKIITIEDPVEYQIPGITQVPVNEKKGLTFARGLRSILRHDPDKIMVGEVRDPETAQIAVQSALTGHLVFTTVHANNVFDVIGRFLHMGVEPYNFVSALNCVMAQRLVRVLCAGCRRRASPSEALLRESGLDPDLYQDQAFYEPSGCAECAGTGFLGRTAVAEMLDMSDRIRQMILERRPAAEIKQAAREEGMTFLRDAALEKVFAGATTLREINKVTFVS
jgi:type IV pilus assembly protein PilB